jgi:PAS domain-containing protein
MSGSHRRHRRRRTGSTARRYRPSELVRTDSRHRSRPVTSTEMLAGIAVGAVTALLIILIWIMANRGAQDQQAEVRDHAERTLADQAAVLAEEVRHELSLIDQSLAILQDAWKQDSDKLDLAKAKKLMPALSAVSDDIFIADNERVIRQDILPAAVGQGIGAAYVTFPHGSLENFDSDGERDNEGRLTVGQTATPIDGRQFLMYVVRPLDHPANWLIGASYRSEELARLYAEADLGLNGISALIDANRGVVQAIVGPSSRRPKLDISKSPMLEAALKSDASVWLGATATDGVVRLLAFHRVKDRDIVVVVGSPLSQVMAPAEGVAEGYRSLAIVGSIVVATIGGLMLWGLYTMRGNARRQRMYERGRIEVMSAQSDLAMARTKANVASTQLNGLVNGLADGVALLDSELCLYLCNPSFAAAARLEPGALRAGLSLDELLRRQAEAGAFGVLDDTEAEVTQRSATLSTEREQAELTQIGPDGELIELHVRGLPDGGLVLILGGLSQWRTTPLGVDAHDDEAASAGAASIEW